MRNKEKERIKRIKISQKSAKVFKKADAFASSLLETGTELSLAVARHLTVRQLQHALLQPQRFTKFPDFMRIANEELVDRKLLLEKEEKHG